MSKIEVTANTELMIDNRDEILLTDKSIAFVKPMKKIQQREKFSSKIDFFFTVLGYTVGLGNVWRFPYLAFKNGGGAFLIAYYIGVIFGAIPMFILEVMVGQYTSHSGPNAWSISPLFKGIGYASAIILFFCSLYYIIIVAWSFYYLIMSVSYVLPWSTCDNWWNTEHCFTPFDDVLNGSFNHSVGSMSLMKSSADEFWRLNVLQLTDSFDEIGTIRWELLGCLALSWVIVYFCIFKGIKWTGKVVYFTSTFPFVLLIIMLIKGLTLDGAWDGIKYLFIPDWSHLQSSQVWVEAVTQAFFSYAVGLNVVTTFGSYNKRKHDSYKDVIILSVISEITCLIAGLVIFSVLGYMAKLTGKDIKDVAEGGPGLAFIAYPSALSQLPLSPLWSFLFFLMLLFIALDSQFLKVEAFITICTDIWPRLRRHRMGLLSTICIASFFICTLFVTKGGIYWFELFNGYSCAGWALLTMVFFECIAIGFGYGVDNFYQNIYEMIGYYPNKFWKFCWIIITPTMCLIFKFL